MGTSRWARRGSGRPLRRRGSAIATMLGIGVAMALTPAAASAATTFGADLSIAPFGQFGPCQEPLSPCFFSNRASSSYAGGSVFTSPITGVLVQWGVRHSSGPMAVDVLKGSTDVEESALQVPPTDGIEQFPTRLPIDAGDRLALHAPSGGGFVADANVAGVRLDTWQPPLAVGETRSPDNFFVDKELLLNGTVEADADRDGYGDETQDLCPSNAATHGPCPPTGQRAAALKRCKARAKKRDWTKKRLKKCRRKALRLPV